jgi:hypothetical protein
MCPFWREGGFVIYCCVLGLASAVPLMSESRGTQDHILLSKLFRLPKLGGLGPRVYPSGTWWPRYTGPSTLTTRRATMEVFEPASTRVFHRPLSWSRTIQSTVTRISPRSLLKFLYIQMKERVIERRRSLLYAANFSNATIPSTCFFLFLFSNSIVTSRYRLTYNFIL